MHWTGFISNCSHVLVLLCSIIGTGTGIVEIRMKSRIKWAALGGLVLSFVSLLLHLFLAKSSASLVQYGAMLNFSDDLSVNVGGGGKGAGYRKLWGNVKSLEFLHPYANPRSTYPGNVVFPYEVTKGELNPKQKRSEEIGEAFPGNISRKLCHPQGGSRKNFKAD
ncbi:unnamed protein product [Ilex paraguariensis]|uniref:Uncharacterized protein n=1 Tax=Ilex paraguariensis TaxID=185542 RepID=A0ABC8TQR8_9AQUA